MIRGASLEGSTARLADSRERLDLGIGEPLLYVFAVALGIGRTVDRAHWASDTWFGIVLGWAVGRLIADRMLDRRAAAPAQQLRVPLYIGWRFAF